MSKDLKVGIVVFPGSNCEQDCYDAVVHYLGNEAVYLWHGDTDLQGVDAVILPGGFSYGDYLRSGALARFSPILESVRAFADQGRPVLGICNGFQVLTETGLLPGALTRNKTLHFICEQVKMTVENNTSLFTSRYGKGQEIMLPVAHGDGNFQAPEDVVKRLEDNGQVVFRYRDDINGSVNRIAGICNEKGNVLGMMPHPERNLWKNEAWTGEGRIMFDSLKAGLLSLAAV